MYRKIIVGYDGKPTSDDALAFAKVISDATGAQLIVAGVARPKDPRLLGWRVVRPRPTVPNGPSDRWDRQQRPKVRPAS